MAHLAHGREVAAGLLPVGNGGAGAWVDRFVVLQATFPLFSLITVLIVLTHLITFFFHPSPSPPPPCPKPCWCWSAESTAGVCHVSLPRRPLPSPHLNHIPPYPTHQLITLLTRFPALVSGVGPLRPVPGISSCGCWHRAWELIASMATMHQ